VEKKEWFAEWFDSPYYHILYKNHDEDEAQRALGNLLSALHLPLDSRILDLACGKGRHSRYLAERGFDVTGLDISWASISHARQFEDEKLHFYQHDMRLPFRINYFDAVLNMFTSFGYFERDADHLRTLTQVARGLKPGGLLLLDYFNSEWVRQTAIPSEEKVVDGIVFHLKKDIRDGHVYKNVAFEHKGKHYDFEERVRLFMLADFEQLFARTGLHLKKTYGDYDLQPYETNTSKRLILVGEKMG
jgi:SAM-dependent methyltransferase